MLNRRLIIFQWFTDNKVWPTGKILITERPGAKRNRHWRVKINTTTELIKNEFTGSILLRSTS